MSSTFYRMGFTNYLYLAHTGLSRSGGFLVKEWRGSNTRITGIESLVSYDNGGRANQNFHIQIFYDLVKNKNVSDDPMRQWAEGDYMPNMPTSRYGLYTSFQSKLWKFETSLEHYLKQKYLGKNINPEPPMPSYSQWTAKLNYQMIICHKNATLYCLANNLLNQEMRSQNSPLKYLAPQPGRNISLGMQLFF